MAIDFFSFSLAITNPPKDCLCSYLWWWWWIIQEKRWLVASTWPLPINKVIIYGNSRSSQEWRKGAFDLFIHSSELGEIKPMTLGDSHLKKPKRRKKVYDFGSTDDRKDCNDMNFDGGLIFYDHDLYDCTVCVKERKKWLPPQYKII